ncbi:MAG: hypothetical protein ABL933_13320 [Methyloglobulus sp.]
MKKLFAVPFLLLAFTVNAQASTVTFEDNEVDAYQPDPFASGELVFKPTSGFHLTYTSTTAANNGTNALIAGFGHDDDGNVAGSFSFKETNNSIFSLDSLDAGIAFNEFPSKTGSVVVTGYQQGGGVLTQTLSLDSIYQNYVFGWANLLFVDVSENSGFGFVAFDNINVTAPEINPVPVPAAVWLFGSALTGLLGFGKRKQTRA